MEITRTPFPVGQLQGFPAMVVDCHGASPEQLIALPRLVRSNMRPADDLVWLRDADWAQTELIDAALVELASHQRTSAATPIAIRKLGEDKWPASQCYWILDVSELLVEPTDPDTIRERTQDLPYFPDVDELVVVAPHPENLTPLIWDELLNWLTPNGPAWAYVEPEQYARACDCMYRADHRAGVRPLWPDAAPATAFKPPMWGFHPC